jgi:hypothetical protein
MKKKLIKAIELDNGLKLKLFDGSRQVAGDRWLVFLIARIEIPIDHDSIRIGSQSSSNVDEIKDALGEKLCFEQKRMRHFVDEKQKDNVLENLTDSFLANCLAYLSHPSFPGRYVLKEYKKTLERKTWYPETKISTDEL